MSRSVWEAPRDYPGGQVRFVLDAANEYGQIDAEMKSIAPGIHFCPSNQDMAVCDGSPEKDRCRCRFDLRN